MQPSATISPAVRRDIERWFVKRGVPQFIEGYGTEQSMDARAAPLITGWIALWTALFWLSRPEAPLPWGVAAIAGSLLFVVVADAIVDRIRGRSRLPPRFDLIDIVLFGALPVIPTLLVQRDALGVLFSVLNVLLGIGAIYIVIGFGLLDIAGWAADRLREQLVQIATLLSRTLPLLLILVVFLMFSAELWEAAHTLTGAELALVLALLIGIGSLLIVTTFRPEVERLQAVRDWDLIREETRDTPAAVLAPVAPSAETDDHVPPLTWLERRNVEFVVLVNQLLQSVFVSLIVFLFLVVFGLVVVPASVQSGWIGGPVTVLAPLDLFGEARVLSAELLVVSGLLSGIVGLYFTGLSLTDATYRAEHVTSMVAELRTVLSARALYRAALGANLAAPPPSRTATSQTEEA